jgi:hypothetical protein
MVTLLCHLRILFVSLTLLTAGAFCARADVFHLTDGGTLTGTLVERGTEDEYVVRTRQGAVVTLSKEQVAKFDSDSEFQEEYEDRSRALPDTVAAHRALADWCKQHQMKAEADHHLGRILELDPDDLAARKGLGYVQHQGRWLSRDELMAERGLAFYDGSYRTAQDIALRERAKVDENVENDWYRQLKLWRDWLESRRGDRAAEAHDKILAIADPEAATSVVRMLDGEQDEEVRAMWIQVLAGLNHPAAVVALVNLSLDEPDRETRLQCVDYLVQAKRPIEISPYVKALKSRDNETINIAAEALAAIGDPQSISPLIDVLVTQHTVPNPNASPGSMSASFSPDGSGGSGLNSGGPKFIKVDLENVEVRRALVRLSGDQDFGFNPQAWRRWYVNRQSQDEYVDARRDR